MKHQCFLLSLAIACATSDARKNDNSPRYCEVEDGQMDVCVDPATSKAIENEHNPPRPVEVKFINDSSKHFHIKFIDSNTLSEDLIVWDLEPKNLDSSNFYSETIDSFTGHEFDVISSANEEEFRIRLIIDEQDLTGDNNDKAVFTITDEMIDPGSAVQVEFINDSSYSFHVNFIDTETLEEEMIIAGLVPAAIGESIKSFPGHEFAIYDEDRTFRVRVVVGQGHEHGDHVVFRITDDMIHPQKPVDVEFINDTSSRQIHINYIDPDIEQEELVVWNLSPKHIKNNTFHSETIQSFTGHDFVAYDDENSFRVTLHVNEDHVWGDTVRFIITDEIIIS